MERPTVENLVKYGVTVDNYNKLGLETINKINDIATVSPVQYGPWGHNRICDYTSKRANGKNARTEDVPGLAVGVVPHRLVLPLQHTVVGSGMSGSCYKSGPTIWWQTLGVYQSATTSSPSPNG